MSRVPGNELKRKRTEVPRRDRRRRVWAVQPLSLCGGDREPVQVRCVIPRAAHPRVLVVRRVPADMEVLTAEFKVNLLTPASGNSLVAEGQVVRPDAR
jgi:hypothetical protein